MNFDPADDARQLHAILTGKTKGGDDTLIKIITSKTNDERQKIKEEYKSAFNADLVKDLQKAYSSNFEDVLVGLFTVPLDYDCYHIRKAVKGLGTDEKALIEILTTRESDHIEEMKKRYKEMYPGRDMVADIKDDTSGHFWQVLKGLLEAKRGKNTVPDNKECESCAKKLHAAFETRNNHTEIFTEILTTKSKEEIREIGKIYNTISKNGLINDIQKLFGSDTRNALLGIIYGILSPPEYFAKLIYESIKGLGTKNSTLIRVLITRDEIDMPQIKQYYKQLYNKDMVEDIKGDTSGNYQKILVELATH